MEGKSGATPERSRGKSSDSSRSFVEKIAAIPVLVRFTILVYIFFFIFTALIVPLFCRPDMMKYCESGISVREQFILLYHINALRMDVASGKQKTGSGQQPHLPSAAAMYKLQWSCVLQEEAYTHASKSKIDETKPAKNVYEYVEISKSSLWQVSENAVADVRSKLMVLTNLQMNEKQLLIDTSTHIGCALIKQAGVQKLTCVLESMVGANKTGDEAYVVGPAGSKCPYRSLEPGMPLCIYVAHKQKPKE
ncbi:hypothetical protein RB195_011882 [Necator americanus]|uniref:SCP domain-containing protein n=1 Tax=Necator americanus TaxID=51031 RepID=A0ABR1D595_NECAM